MQLLSFANESTPMMPMPGNIMQACYFYFDILPLYGIQLNSGTTVFSNICLYVYIVDICTLYTISFVCLFPNSISM